ncbi:hypothetical protein Tco_0845764 [Tanacetum coccineum]
MGYEGGGGSIGVGVIIVSWVWVPEGVMDGVGVLVLIRWILTVHSWGRLIPQMCLRSVDIIPRLLRKADFEEDKANHVEDRANHEEHKANIEQERANGEQKKAKAEPTPPACDPCDVEKIERYVNRLYQPRHNDHVVDRDDRYRDDPIRSLGLKIEIPEFTGKVHPDNFIDWLSTVERVFVVRDIPNKLKVKLVAIKLRQHA